MLHYNHYNRLYTADKVIEHMSWNTFCLGWVGGYPSALLLFVVVLSLWSFLSFSSPHSDSLLVLRCSVLRFALLWGGEGVLSSFLFTSSSIDRF